MILPMEQNDKPVLNSLIGPLPSIVYSRYTRFCCAQSLISDDRDTPYIYVFKTQHTGFCCAQSFITDKSNIRDTSYLFYL